MSQKIPSGNDLQDQLETKPKPKPMIPRHGGNVPLDDLKRKMDRENTEAERKARKLSDKTQSDMV